jgi:prevent-host-death family protein
VVKDVTATEAARRFSDLLDAVEHRGEAFTIVRNGRPVALVTRARQSNGAAFKRLLREFPGDAEWARDIAETRALLRLEDRSWTD